MIMAYKVNPFLNSQSSVLQYIPNRNHILLMNNNSIMKNLIKTVVFLRLRSNDSFWYYIEFSDGNKLVGYRKVNNKWIYMPVQISNIAFYY